LLDLRDLELGRTVTVRAEQISQCLSHSVRSLEEDEEEVETGKEISILIEFWTSAQNRAEMNVFCGRIQTWTWDHKCGMKKFGGIPNSFLL